VKQRRFYPDEPGLAKFLPQGELDVMEALWAGKHTTSAIRQHINKGHSTQTVKTTLLRLIEKGLVSKGIMVFDRATFYPSQTRSNFIRDNISRILKTLFNDTQLQRSVYNAALDITIHYSDLVAMGLASNEHETITRQM
jgi:predicted transcriptional regulator